MGSHESITTQPLPQPPQAFLQNCKPACSQHVSGHYSRPASLRAWAQKKHLPPAQLQLQVHLHFTQEDNPASNLTGCVCTSSTSAELLNARTSASIADCTPLMQAVRSRMRRILSSTSATRVWARSRRRTYSSNQVAVMMQDTLSAYRAMLGLAKLPWFCALLPSQAHLERKRMPLLFLLACLV